MICTMHGATRHCMLRTRGCKRLKAPRNEELFVFLFGKKPAVQLHSAYHVHMYMLYLHASLLPALAREPFA